MTRIGKKRALSIAYRLRSEFIYNMAKLEGNSLSFAEAETVIYGTSVAGKAMRELHQIENIRDAWDELIDEVRGGRFSCDKYSFCNINHIVSAGENNDGRGGFRRENVATAWTKYLPPMPVELNAIFDEMILRTSKEPPDIRALDIFMESARNQYFGDGNKRTALLMMNGLLMEAAYSPISIDPKDEAEYRSVLIDYYESGEKDAFRSFMLRQQDDILRRFRLEAGEGKGEIQPGSTIPRH